MHCCKKHIFKIKKTELKPNGNSFLILDRIFNSKGPVSSSSRGGGGRHLGGDQNSAHSKRGEMDNKEHFKRKTKEFILKSWSGD